MLGRKPKNKTLTEALRRETIRITKEKTAEKLASLRAEYEANVAKDPEGKKGYYLILKAETEKTNAARDYLLAIISKEQK